MLFIVYYIALKKVTLRLWSQGYKFLSIVPIDEICSLSNKFFLQKWFPARNFLDGYEKARSEDKTVNEFVWEKNFLASQEEKQLVFFIFFFELFEVIFQIYLLSFVFSWDRNLFLHLFPDRATYYIIIYSLRFEAKSLILFLR